MIFAQHNFHLTFASHCYRLKSLEAYMSFARAGPPKAAPARVYILYVGSRSSAYVHTYLHFFPNDGE